MPAQSQWEPGLFKLAGKDREEVGVHAGKGDLRMTIYDLRFLRKNHPPQGIVVFLDFGEGGVGAEQF